MRGAIVTESARNVCEKYSSSLVEPTHFALDAESAILRLLHAVSFSSDVAGQVFQGRGTQVA
jgi:hypothetical protein